MREIASERERERERDLTYKALDLSFGEPLTAALKLGLV